MLAKKFLLFLPHVDEEKKKMLLCSELRSGKGTRDYRILDTKLCPHCRVFLMSDRFLGNHFNKTTGIPRNKYPYVLIANAAGCNLNCWYCYAHKMIKKEDYEKLEPVFLSPEDLARCFICKMGYASDYRTERNRFPIFSRVRITGGEPLASSTDTLVGFDNDLYEGTVEFWKRFFVELNRGIAALIAEGRIKLVQAEEFKPLLKQAQFDRPTWVTLKTGKITIRFDSNGLLFCSRKNTEKFLTSIEDLNKSAGGSRLYVEIDYSLKGATPTEFEWSRRSHIDLLSQDQVEEFGIEKHPQFAGIKNIIEIEANMKKEYPELEDCLYLTVEKGIDNHVGKCYLFHEKSLQWRQFEEKVNLKLALSKPFKLSEVKNTIQWTKSYGPKPYLRRYLNRGAKIILKCENKSFECSPADPPSSLDRLIEIKKKLEAEGMNCILILSPVLSSQKTIADFKD